MSSHGLITDRLHLRLLREDDAAFILRLLNDPTWLRHIGDRGVHTLDDAHRYITHGPVARITGAGVGLFLIERRSDGAAMGLCGLLKREGLDDVDIGFALLPEFSGHGYALEAARATLEHAFGMQNLPRVLAITSQDNTASMRLLEKLGFRYERDVVLPRDTTPLRLFAAVPGDAG